MTLGRGSAFFHQSGVAGFTHRAFTKSMGFDDEDMRKPVIGICNTYSEAQQLQPPSPRVGRGGQARRLAGRRLSARVSDHLPGRDLPQPHLDALPQPGGYGHRGDDPRPTARRRGTAGQLRQDHPAALMGAASADLPAILRQRRADAERPLRGQMLGACTDCRRLTAEYQAGNAG